MATSFHIEARFQRMQDALQKVTTYSLPLANAHAAQGSWGTSTARCQNMQMAMQEVRMLHVLLVSRISSVLCGGLS